MQSTLQPRLCKHSPIACWAVMCNAGHRTQHVCGTDVTGYKDERESWLQEAAPESATVQPDKPDHTQLCTLLQAEPKFSQHSRACTP